MTIPANTDRPPPTGEVGKRVELGRYTIPAGERILHGQRINGVVRFLPGDRVVLGGVRVDSEDDVCRPSGRSASVGRAHAVRQKRPHSEVPPLKGREAS